MDKKITSYINEFIEETSLAFYLDGKYEVRKYAPYWICDIYSFALSLYSHTLFTSANNNLCHEYNPSGNEVVEHIADTIYNELKKVKLFSYFYEIEHRNLRGLVSCMNIHLETIASESITSFDESKGMSLALYGVHDVLPLPISSFPVFSYMEDSFTPDVCEYEGLRRSLDELKKVMSIMYCLVDRETYLQSIKEVVSEFEIPLNHLLETTINNDSVELKLYLNGIERQRHARKLVYSNSYEADFTGLGMCGTLKHFFSDAVQHVIGISKSRGSETPALYGVYPMKDLNIHGLKLELPDYMQDRVLRIYEAQSLHLIKETLLLPGKPVVSTSYGADSVLVQHLVKKVYPSIDVYHGKTGLDFPEIYKVEKKLIEKGVVDVERLYYGKNETSYWDMVDDYGFNFERKGKRKENSVGLKTNRSEKCCNSLKHIPFMNAIKENDWNINFAGLRADESRARELAAKRDGPIYFATSWNLFRVNPIIFWTDSMVWEYTKSNDIPYASIYDMVLKNDQGEVLFKPRIGCWACMLSAKYGYLKWLREYKPKQYRFIMIDKGLLRLLYAKKMGHKISINGYGKEYGDIEDEDFDPDYLLGFLEQRPCFFDETLVAI